jgi:hypothetical protein
MEEKQNVSKDKPLDKYDQYVDTMQRMQYIAQAMRDEETVPAPQKPTNDASVITHVEFIKEGGIFTYLARYDFPFRGFPLNDTVQSMDELKKLAKIIIQKFLPYVKNTSLFGKLTLLLSVNHLKKLAECYLYAYHWHVKRYRLKPYMYSQAVRELWDTINKSLVGNQDIKEAIRDLSCMFLEFDNAYRFRFQDIMPEMNIEAMKKDPGKEIGRLLDLMAEREIWEEKKTRMAEKWKMAKELISLFLRFSPSTKKIFVDMAIRMDLKRIELTTEDRYYCEFRKDYKFGFMQREGIPVREVPKGNEVENKINENSPQVETNSITN